MAGAESAPARVDWMEAPPGLVRRANRFAATLFAGVAALTIACWLATLRRYSLFHHGGTPHYSLTRAREQLGDSALTETGLLFLTLAALYCAGYLLLTRVPAVSPAVKLAVVGMALAGGGVNVLLYPVGAGDVFLYLAELKLTYYYGRNPYLVTFQAFENDPFARFSFFLDTPLVYGPAWLLVSGPPVLVGGFGDVLRALVAYKVFSLLVTLLCGLLVYSYHEDERGRWLGLYAFLAHPLLLFEAVGNAHNDALMACFVLAALVALRRGSLLVGPAVVLALGVKPLAAPVVPVVAVAMAARRWSRHRIAAVALAALGTGLLLLAPFWAGGRLVGGMARGIAVSQGLDSYSLVALLRLYQRGTAGVVDSLPLRVGLGLLFVLLALAVARWDHRLERGALSLVLLFYLLVSSLFPWYFILAIGLAALWDSSATRVLLCSAAALGLSFYPVLVAVNAMPGWSPVRAHAAMAPFLLLPILGFFAFAYSPRDPRQVERVPGGGGAVTRAK